MAMDPWKTHDWFDRPVEIDREKVIQFVCRKCFRSFVDDATGRRYAIYASAFTVHRLSDEVTNRGFRNRVLMSARRSIKKL
jgi:hypothetical protein